MIFWNIFENVRQAILAAWIQSLRAMGVMSDHNARATSLRLQLAFEACLEPARV